MGSLPWTDRSESLGQVNHFLKDKSEEQEMNKPDDDNEKVGDENIQAVQEVTKMKATSTTSNSEGDRTSPDVQGENKTGRKKKLFLSKEKKDQAEYLKRYSPAEVKDAIDAVKTNKRIQPGGSRSSCQEDP